MVWTYGWLTLMVGCLLATAVVAAMENARRKKMINDRLSGNEPSIANQVSEDGFEAMDDLDEIPADPDFDFPQN